MTISIDFDTIGNENHVGSKYFRNIVVKNMKLKPYVNCLLLVSIAATLPSQLVGQSPFFSEPLSIPSESIDSLTPRGIASGDFNADGNLDIAIYAGTDYLRGSSLAILLGSKDLTFSDSEVIRDPFGADAELTPRVLVADDFNSDSVCDLIALTDFVPDSLTCHLYVGNGIGSFSGPSFLSAGGNFRIADLDGDGEKDIVSGAPFQSSIRVRLGVGKGQVGPETFFSTGRSNLFPSLDLADFNNDGIFDVVVDNDWDGNLSILLGTGDGAFSEHSITKSGDIGGILFAPALSDRVTAGDFDGDGNMDICHVLRGPQQSFSILYGLGDGTFEPFQTVLGPTSFSLSIVDINLDGRDDIVAFTDEETKIFLSDIDRSFTQAAPIPFGFCQIEIADYNGDSLPDISGTQRNQNEILLFLHQGVPQLIGDLNGDGMVNFLDVAPFVDAILSNRFSVTADVNQDGEVNVLDIAPFVALITG